MTGLRMVWMSESGEDYPVWVHGRKDWVFCENMGVWINKTRDLEIPQHFCLGDRYISTNYGEHNGDVVLVGSSSKNWHGGWGPQKSAYDLHGAIEWLKKTPVPEAGYALWASEEQKREEK